MSNVLVLSIDQQSNHSIHFRVRLENYDTIKQSQGDEDMPSREIMTLVGQQWAQTTPAEKQMWQIRADQMKRTNTGTSMHPQQHGEEELPELPATTEETVTTGKKRARKQPARGVSAVAAAAIGAVAI